MTQREFEYKFRDYQGVPITEDYTIWRKPLSVSNSRADGVTVKFKVLDEALNFQMNDGRRVIDVIETWSAMPDCMLDAPVVWHFKD